MKISTFHSIIIFNQIWYPDATANSWNQVHYEFATFTVLGPRTTSLIKPSVLLSTRLHPRVPASQTILNFSLQMTVNLKCFPNQYRKRRFGENEVKWLCKRFSNNCCCILDIISVLFVEYICHQTEERQVVLYIGII